MITKIIVRFFDKIEDKVRARLSHRSIIYALIGGALTVLFWRAIWHTADKIMLGKGFFYMFNEAKFLLKTRGIWSVVFYEPITLIWTLSLLLLTGLFVSIMIGDKIIISGIKNEKRVDEKTESEIKKEEGEIKNLVKKVNSISSDVEEIKLLLKK